MATEEMTNLEENGEDKMQLGRFMSYEEYRRHYMTRTSMQHRMERDGTDDNTTRRTGHVPTSQTGSFSPMGQHREDEEQQARGLEQNMLNRFQLDRAVLVQCARVIGRVLLATVLVFRSVTPYNLIIMLGVYLAYLLLRNFFTSIRVERERADNLVGTRGDAPAPGSQRHRRVSSAHKAFYIFTRCVTSFVLSMFPTYSVEQLDAELAHDNILSPYLHQD